MHFTWLGTTAMKIQTKHLGKDVVIVIDPYKPAQGAFPRNMAPNIGLYTRGEKGSITLSGSPFVLSRAGECETGGVLITAAAGHQPETTMLRIDAEGISVAHLGLTNKTPSNKQFDTLSGVDILCLPIGHTEAFSTETAMKVVSIIEPRVIIPIAFKSANDPRAKGVDGFLKEMGVTDSRPEAKIIIKKKDLPQEETQVIILKKE
jgi:hypothetical protein